MKSFKEELKDNRMVETHCSCCGCRMIIPLNESYSMYEQLCEKCKEEIEVEDDDKN